jgi:hypothetical protein
MLSKILTQALLGRQAFVRARSLLRIAGPSPAERSQVGCKEQRSAEYWTYSSKRRRSSRPGSARLATRRLCATGS